MDWVKGQKAELRRKAKAYGETVTIEVITGMKTP